MSPPQMTSTVFHLRSRSLLRGTMLVLISLAASFYFSGFPQDRRAPILLIPALLSLYGTYETIRCLRLRWSFYHGGVLLLVYMDILVIVLILFLLLYPYTDWFL
jgi:hypothetical protein